MEACRAVGDNFHGSAGYLGHAKFVDVAHCKYVDTGLVYNFPLTGINIANADQDHFVRIQFRAITEDAGKIRITTT